MPAIVANPPLRMIGLLACVVDLTAVISAAAFRLRLKTLSWKGEDEQFAKVNRLLSCIEASLITLVTTECDQQSLYEVSSYLLAYPSHLCVWILLTQFYMRTN